MKKSVGVKIWLLLFGCMVFAALGQDEMKPWEKYGISQSEWKLTKDNNISVQKLELILSSGISVTEYCQRPWKKLAMKESEWMDKRRAGMSSYDIELEYQSEHSRFKHDNKNTLKSDSSSARARQSQALFTGFFLPGFEQQRLGQNRGKVMSYYALGCIAGCIVWSVAQARIEPVPLVLVIPDMFWSLVDYKITLKKQESE